MMLEFRAINVFPSVCYILGFILVWGLLTRISGQPCTFDPNFGIFRVKALKSFQKFGVFLVKVLKNRLISGRVGFKMEIKGRVFRIKALKKFKIGLKT